MRLSTRYTPVNSSRHSRFQQKKKKSAKMISRYIDEYESWGWCLLPVKIEDKSPAMTTWEQFITSPPDPQTVRRWFSALSGVGVGAVTGKTSGIVVLDVEATCPTPIQDLLERFPTERIARTGSGGYHLYYHYPSGVTRVQNQVRIFDGADIRADGGFIVLPPTLHPSGIRYEWIKKGPLGACPAAFLEQKETAPSRNEGWVTEALRGATQGSRNDTCARLAGYFYGKGMTTDVVEALLMDWNLKNEPPMSVKEVKATIRSIEKSHAENVLRTFTSVEFTDDRPAQPATNTGKKSDNSGFDVIKLGDYVRKYAGAGVSWLVQDWLPDKSITFLVSPPESYKTWLLLDLAVSIATGSPFLGQFPLNSTGPALIIQQEDSHEGLTDRLALIVDQKLGVLPKLEDGKFEIPATPDIPIYIHPSRQLRFDNANVIEEVEKKIAAIRPKVVLIDPLYSVISTDNYMSAGAEQMMVLKTWRDKYGCSFILAHHSKKNVDPDSTAREDSWGSQFLNAFLEAGWQIRRNQKLAQNEVVVRRHSKTMGNQPPISLTFDISTEYPMKYSVNIKDYETQGPARPAQHDLINMMSEDFEYSQVELCNMTGKSRSTISRQIKQLESAGAIVKMPNGKIRRKD